MLQRIKNKRVFIQRQRFSLSAFLPTFPLGGETIGRLAWESETTLK